MQVPTINSRISAIVSEHLDKLSDRIATTTYTDTYRAMLSLFVRTDSLKAAILGF